MVCGKSKTMSEVFEGYERQYCELSANLSKKCATAGVLDGGNWKIPSFFSSYFCHTSRIQMGRHFTRFLLKYKSFSLFNLARITYALTCGIYVPISIQLLKGNHTVLRDCIYPYISFYCLFWNLDLGFSWVVFNLVQRCWRVFLACISFSLYISILWPRMWLLIPHYGLFFP